MNKDILLTVFTFLKPEEACKINLTSKMFLEVYRHNILWKLYCEKYMTGEEIAGLCKNNNYFECYNIWFDVKNFMKKIYNTGKIVSNKHAIRNSSNCTVLELMNNTMYLDCEYARLGRIPREIYRLQNLVTVSFSSNNLTELPKELFLLSKLEFLSLKNNNITEIPDDLCDLINLKKLILKSNNIKEIPDAIKNITGLTTLNLCDNEIENIPIFLENMVNLIDLDLSYNKIKEVPNFLQNMVNCHVDLMYNDIGHVPEDLLDILVNNKVFLVGNPFWTK